MKHFAKLRVAALCVIGAAALLASVPSRAAYVVVDGIHYVSANVGIRPYAAVVRPTIYNPHGNAYQMAEPIIHDTIWFDYPAEYQGIAFPVEKICERAFSGSYCTKIVLPHTIKVLESYAFAYSYGLESITLNDSLETIGEFCFTYNNNLTSIVIPDRVKSLPNCFVDCANLASVTLGRSVESLDGTFMRCTSLESIVLPNSLSNMSNTFEGCTALKTITLPSSVKYIGGAFDGCTSLTTLVMSDSLETIDMETFRNCTSLKTLSLPATLRSISTYALDGCSALTEIYCAVRNPRQISVHRLTFQGFDQSACTLHVPKGSKALYESSMIWNKFQRIVDDIPCEPWAELNKGTATLMAGEAKRLVLTTAAGDWTVDWTTSDPLVAQVDADGMVKALAPGQATVTATATGSDGLTLSGRCQVTVDAMYYATDVTGDELTDIGDVNVMLNMMSGKATGNIPRDKADVNGDGTVDIADVNITINQMLGKKPYKLATSTTYRVADREFKMTMVEGGTFGMGATAEQSGRAADDELPVHDVTLKSFCIGQTEVTQWLWYQVMTGYPSSHRSGLQLPVEQVSWEDCQLFVELLNQKTGEHFRLPTEAEWERAARGGSESSGCIWPGSNDAGAVAWCRENSLETHDVATKAPNELGIYDMAGNVAEWCQDRYGAYGTEALTDPVGPEAGDHRVVRGGAMTTPASDCRVTSRSHEAPATATMSIGLRLAM